MPKVYVFGRPNKTAKAVMRNGKLMRRKPKVKLVRGNSLVSYPRSYRGAERGLIEIVVDTYIS